MQARLVLGGAMLGLVFGAVELGRCPAVVGFEVARGVQWKPTHGDETAMNGAPGVSGGMAVQPVSIVRVRRGRRISWPGRGSW